MSWRLGIDIGGAFTDFYILDSKTGKTSLLKIESTPPNFEDGVIQGIEELEKQGFCIKNTSQIIHGQTVVINTIITRSGSKVGFITTKGYDILDIQRANRRDIFNFKYQKPSSFISGYMTEYVRGYIDSDGSIHESLNEEDVKKATESLLQKEAEAFAIGFINSYCNISYELKAKKIVEKILREKGYKNLFVTVSSDLSREWREYERFSTAVLNAYVQPLFVRYIGKLEDALKEKGFNGIFWLTLASGGMTSVDFAKQYPITTIEGGPVSGIIGGTTLGKLMNERDIIIVDGGSTTTKAGLVKNLVPQINTEYWIEQNDWESGYPIRVPAININEIGTGGTSIIWVDEAGNLQVGPKAAGSRPGPACYNMGGENPTLTDAYVVTGYLNPDYLLGGKLKIYKKLAEMSFKGVAKKLKLDIIDAAYGAIRVANDNSSNLIRLISIRKGFDPREFTLIAHGGSGPMIAPFIAEELSFSKVVVPTIPSGVFNAWGMIGLDIRHELVQTNVILIEKSEKFLKAINPIFRKLEDKINNVFEKEEIGSKKIEIQRFLDMQYEGQAHTLKVQCPDGKLDVKKIEKIIKTFHDVHFREYGFNLYNSGIEIVNFHLAGLHKVEHPKIKKDTNHNLLENVLIGERKVYNGHKKIIMNVYKKESLPTNILIDFPCIIEDKTSTIIVTENFKAHRDEYGNLIILKK